MLRIKDLEFGFVSLGYEVNLDRDPDILFGAFYILFCYWILIFKIVYIIHGL